MNNKNLITEIDIDEEEYSRYSRHIMLPEIGEEGQKKLKGSKVLVIGAGGLGSPVIFYLAAAGIGTIGIVDYDEVDLSNLQRQIIHNMDNLGTAKVKSAADKVRKLNKHVEVKEYQLAVNEENICDIISQYDFVIDCVDNYKIKFLINDACVKIKKPFCYGGVANFEGHIMTYVPDKGPCLRCVFDDIDKDDTPKEIIGVLGVMPGIIGSYQALEAIKFLTGIGENLVGRFLIINGLNCTQKIMNIDRASWCQTCGEEY